MGFDEDGNTIFLDMGDGVFALQLESLKVSKILETGSLRPYMDDSYVIPYMSFFVAGVLYLHISAYMSAYCSCY